MPTCKNYIGIVLLAAWQLCSAQPKNDSVFTGPTLASIRLSDAGKRAAVSIRPADHPNGAVLFVFLSPECPLCQNYTSVINRLDREFAGKIKIYGIVPGKAYLPAEITAFAQKYKIAFPLLIDSTLRLTHYLQASTTPEAILLGPDYELLYKGAIDNWYQALGRNRLRPTENYLQDAIGRYFRKESYSPKRTTPVGCLINDY